MEKQLLQSSVSRAIVSEWAVTKEQSNRRSGRRSTPNEYSLDAFGRPSGDLGHRHQRRARSI